MIPFVKYHALGNDYIILTPQDSRANLLPDQVRWLCHRHYGVGADGVLWGPIPSEMANFGLRIFNPDGSEAEKSGNGLRIFARYLWDRGQVGQEPFTVQTAGGLVRCQVQADGQQVVVEMGCASFWSQDIPVSGPRREVVGEQLLIDETTFSYCALSLGNPHCVLFCEKVTPELALQFGPQVENDPHFPQRTNVQFLQVLDRQNLRIEIWERGAGYTLASGSSSCAAAAAAFRLGLCEPQVDVHMPGGVLQVGISLDGLLTLTGPVGQVYEGRLWNLSTLSV